MNIPIQPVPKKKKNKNFTVMKYFVWNKIGLITFNSSNLQFSRRLEQLKRIVDSKTKNKKLSITDIEYCNDDGPSAVLYFK